jgi:glutathionylspermidine synthase
VTNEQNQLSITDSAVDSINNTFRNTTHASFYVGTTLISTSNCRAIATYVNDAAQAVTTAADFQEILLDDNTDALVYATVLEPGSLGYNNGRYDFQMIVAEDPTTTVPSTYYFWAELS